MGRQKIDLHRKVREVPQHTAPLLPEWECPLRHFEDSTNAGLLLLKYLRIHIDTEEVYKLVYERHLGQLRRMILAELTESFERFLKELAAVCADFLAPFADDDRFEDFIPKHGYKIAAFVNAGSIGKALCESDTWINNATINSRFASLLKNRDGADWEHLFPKAGQQPAAHRDRAATLAILWQIRHNLAHNVGVLTHSDAMKFRVLIGGAVDANCRLSPSMDDIRYVKRFLSETATITNQRVGSRLAAILDIFHVADPGLFDAQAKADQVSRSFTFSVTINQHVGVQ